MFKRWLPTWLVQWFYLQAGIHFGDAVSYSFMGESCGFEALFDRWAFWEREYARRGYVTLTIDDFVDIGGYGTPIEGLGIKRAADEPARLHAEMYRQQYLGRIEPAIDLPALIEPGASPQTGTYVLPSTTSKGGRS